MLPLQRLAAAGRAAHRATAAPTQQLRQRRSKGSHQLKVIPARPQTDKEPKRRPEAKILLRKCRFRRLARGKRSGRDKLFASDLGLGPAVERLCRLRRSSQAVITAFYRIYLLVSSYNLVPRSWRGPATLQPAQARCRLTK